MSRHELIRFQSDDALAGEAATRWVAAAISGRVRTVALSGGRIAARLFAAAVSRSRAASNAVAGSQYFWADERCVPPADPDSNLAVAHAALLAPLGVPEERIHRVRGEIDPARAAKEAEAEICRLVALDGHGRPVLDLVLLGIGEDGHVASIFPNDAAALAEVKAVYVPVTAPKPPP